MQRSPIITIDAIGTQRSIAEEIVERKADYILAVKANQKTLQHEVISLCATAKPVSDTTVVEKGHGRIETRHCQVFEKGIMVDEEAVWAGLETVIKITATRQIRDKTTTQERYYISSLKSNADFNKHIRSHWAVENNLHWTLDMTFREDEARKRNKNAAQNFAVIRKIAEKRQRKRIIKIKKTKSSMEQKIHVKIVGKLNALTL